MEDDVVIVATHMDGTTDASRELVFRNDCDFLCDQPKLNRKAGGPGPFPGRPDRPHSRKGSRQALVLREDAGRRVGHCEGRLERGSGCGIRGLMRGVPVGCYTAARRAEAGRGPRWGERCPAGLADESATRDRALSPHFGFARLTRFGFTGVRAGTDLALSSAAPSQPSAFEKPGLNSDTLWSLKIGSQMP